MLKWLVTLLLWNGAVPWCGFNFICIFKQHLFFIVVFQKSFKVKLHARYGSISFLHWAHQLLFVPRIIWNIHAICRMHCFKVLMGQLIDWYLHTDWKSFRLLCPPPDTHSNHRFGTFLLHCNSYRNGGRLQNH